ncbi:MAG: OsmC family protein [Ignavibacteriae bacterium]|nr:OsmC family protein [Ignavibacteriota bacterium]
MGEVKTMTVQHLSGHAFAAKGGSNHYAIIDGGSEGQPAGAQGPMEMILAALGSCSGGDVVEILKKKRQDVRRFSVQLSGERAEDHPRVYKKIHMKFIIHGKNVERAAAERAIELSLTKYCSINGMLSKVVDITHDYELHEWDAETEHVSG